MITTVSYGLLLQLTCSLVYLSTRQLQIMITDVSCGLSLQLTCSLVYSFLCYRVFLTSNLFTCLLVNLSTIITRVIREIRSSKYFNFKEPYLSVRHSPPLEGLGEVFFTFRLWKSKWKGIKTSYFCALVSLSLSGSCKNRFQKVLNRTSKGR